MIRTRFFSPALLGLALAAMSACGGPKKTPEPAAPQEKARIAAAVEAMADNWNGQVPFVTYFNTLDPSHKVSESGTVPSAFDPNDEYWGLPRDEGVDYVAGYCAGCHSLQIVMQQRRNEKHWHELIDWMINTQGMPAPPEDVRQEIEAYLGRNFGEQAP